MSRHHLTRTVFTHNPAPRGWPLVLCLSVLICALSPQRAVANPFLAQESAPVPAVAVAGPGFFVDLQLSLRDRAGSILSAFKDEPSFGGVAALFFIALLYGILHAAGPGHRKTVVFSLFLARRAGVWEPLAAGFLSAFVHAISGALLIGALALIRGAIGSLSDTSAAGAWFDAGTFLLLLVISAALIIRKVVDLLHRKDSHQHIEGGRGLYGIIAVASIVPCPGAIMILLFALYLGLPWAGLFALFSMSLGMGAVVSAAGYLAWFGRETLFTGLKSRERAVALASGLLEIAAYLLVFLFSLYALLPAFPTILDALLSLMGRHP